VWLKTFLCGIHTIVLLLTIALQVNLWYKVVLSFIGLFLNFSKSYGKIPIHHSPAGCVAIDNIFQLQKESYLVPTRGRPKAEVLLSAETESRPIVT